MKESENYLNLYPSVGSRSTVTKYQKFQEKGKRCINLTKNNYYRY